MSVYLAHNEVPASLWRGLFGDCSKWSMTLRCFCSHFLHTSPGSATKSESAMLEMDTDDAPTAPEEDLGDHASVVNHHEYMLSIITSIRGV